MHPELGLLEQVHQLDTAYKRLVQKANGHKQALVDARDAASKAQTAVQRAEEALSSHRDHQRALDRTISRHQSSKASAERALNQGIGNLEAADRQRLHVIELLDQVETEVLEAMERQEELEAALAGKQGLLTQANDALAIAETEHPAAVDVLRATAKENRGLRALRIAKVSPSRVREYEHLLKRKGSGVAFVIEDACSACRMAVQPQHVSDLLKGHLHPCRSCGRFLIPPSQE